MMQRCLVVLAALCAVATAAATTPAPPSSGAPSSSSSQVPASMIQCSQAAIQTATKALFSNPAGPLGACAQSLDMLPRQYLSLQRPTATHCRLLVNNSACSAFNDAYNTAMQTIKPVCLLSPTQPSSVPKPYDAFVAEWCAPPPQAAPRMAPNATNGTKESVATPTITVPQSTRPVIDVNTLPPPKQSVQSAAAPSTRAVHLYIAAIVAVVLGVC